MSAKSIGFLDTVSDRFLGVLTDRQHVAPHRAIQEAIASSLGLDPSVMRNALARRGIDPQKSIGRLRRVELALLARALANLSPNTESAATESAAIESGPLVGTDGCAV